MGHALCAIPPCAHVPKSAPTTSLLEYPPASGPDSCASPSVQPVSTQALVNTSVITGCAGRSSTDFFDARWLLFQLQIPSNYAGGGGNYWQMNYSVTGGTSTDTFTLAVNYANSPVHLL